MKNIEAVLAPGNNQREKTGDPSVSGIPLERTQVGDRNDRVRLGFSSLSDLLRQTAAKQARQPQYFLSPGHYVSQ
jgi:hypothetical protein